MTTIISRLYKNEATAKKVMKELKSKGFPNKLMDMVGAGEDAQSRIEATQVNGTSAAAYAGKMAEGNALVVVRAPVTPFGAARNAMAIVDSKPTINAGVENENEFISSITPMAKQRGSILADHPRFLTPAPEDRSTRPGTISDKFGFQLISKRPRKTSVMPGTRHMSTAVWPIPLLSTRERKPSVMPDGPHMSTSFWSMPLLDKRERSISVRKGGGFPFSEKLGIPLLVKR